MIRLLAFALVAFAGSTALAQITITAEDLPLPGQSYVTSTAAIDKLDPSSTGQDFVWDYSNLIATGSTEAFYIALEEAPFAYQFLFNNPFDPDHNANVAIEQEVGIETELVSVDDAYGFFKTDEETHSLVGFGATISGIPVPTQNNPTDEIYQLPLNFGDSHTSNSSFELLIPALATVYTDQLREVEVDGYGTVSTPYGTFDCLRVRTVINATDSILTDFFPDAMVTPRPENIIYTWLAAEAGVPVLEITTQFGGITQISFKDQELAIGEISDQEDLGLALINGQISVSHTEDLVSLEAYDLAGRLIMQWNPQEASFDLEAMPRGMFVIKALWNNGAVGGLRVAK